MSILDINQLETNIENDVAPSIEKIERWLDNNSIKGYTVPTAYPSGRRLIDYCVDGIIRITVELWVICIHFDENGFPIFVPQALEGNMHMMNMGKFHNRKPLYIKKGVTVPYFIKKAAEIFYYIKYI